MRVLAIVVGAILAGGACAALAVFGALEGWGRPGWAAQGDTAAFIRAAKDKLATESRGNYAYLQLAKWKIVGEGFGSAGRAVGRNTRFQVASLSKFVTALGVMRLVDQGRIGLDAPVSRYLKRWSLPPSKFDNDGVTVRRLLSHTAGLTDGLGYGGFKPGEQVQSLPESLSRAADASPGADGAVRTGVAPGTAWEYSGGGYALLQLMIEDVTGQSFENFMQETVFGPLGMTRSSFVLADDAPDMAEFFAEKGGRAIHYRFAALAAASLYTSAGDLAKLVQAHRGPATGFLSEASLLEMRKPQARRFGIEIWGLGAVLYAPSPSGGFVIGHDGSNAPAINTTLRFDPDSGDGIVVLLTGNVRLASEIGGAWTFWHTGKLDLISAMMEARTIGIYVAVAGGLGFLVTLTLGFALTRRRV